MKNILQNYPDFIQWILFFIVGDVENSYLKKINQFLNLKSTKMAKNEEKSVTYEQVLVGEKIKEILRKEYSKKSIVENSYKKHPKDGTVILFITWSTHNFAALSSTFLVNNFLVKQEKITGSMNDKDSFVIYLGDVLHNTQAMTRLNHYYKKNCSGMLSEYSIENIISNMEIYGTVPSDKKEEAKPEEAPGSIVNDANVVDETSIEEKVGEDIDIPVNKVETEEKPIVEIETGNPSSEPIQKTKGPYKKKVQEVAAVNTKAQVPSSSTSRSLDRFNLVLKVFFKNQSFFESKFDNSEFKDINSMLTFGSVNEYVQHITCVNDSAALLIEKMAKWHTDDYKGQELVRRDGVDIFIDASVFIKGQNPIRSTAGSFCLPPSRGASVEELKQRLHRVRYLGDFTLKQGVDCFAVRYKTVESTNNIFYLVSVSMGWKAELKDNCFIVFTGPNPVLPDTSDFAGFKKLMEYNKPIITPKSDGTATYSVRVRRTDSDVSSKKNQSPRDNSIKKKVEEKVFTEPIKAEQSAQATATEAPKPLTIKDLFEKSEVVVKFQEIYGNDSYWEKISDDNKRKVISVLRSDLKAGDPEIFALYLLSLDSEDRPLFSEEEAVEEFRTMFMNPSFSDSYKSEIQNKIKFVLKEHFVNSDPERFITETIDLFV